MTEATRPSASPSPAPRTATTSPPPTPAPPRSPARWGPYPIVPPPTATATAAPRTYGTATPASSAAPTAAQTGDNTPPTSPGPAPAASPTLSLPDALPISDPNSKLGNYDVSSTNGALTVTKAALSVKTSTATRTYDRGNPAVSVALTGAQNGDNITATYASAATVASPVGALPNRPPPHRHGHRRPPDLWYGHPGLQRRPHRGPDRRQHPPHLPRPRPGRQPDSVPSRRSSDLRPEQQAR